MIFICCGDLFKLLPHIFSASVTVPLGNPPCTSGKGEKHSSYDGSVANFPFDSVYKNISKILIDKIITFHNILICIR